MNENKNASVLINGEEEAKKYSKDLFSLAKQDENIHDQAFETKPVSYLHDSFNRFAKNRASIVAAVIILIIALYAIIVPLASPRAHASGFVNGFYDDNFANALPYNPMFKGSGFWDGTHNETKSENEYKTLSFDDSNHKRILALNSVSEKKVGKVIIRQYNVKTDTYAIGNKVLKVSPENYSSLVDYEKEKGIYQTEKSIMKPLVDSAKYLAEYTITMRNDGVAETRITTIIDKMTSTYNQGSNIYFKLTAKTAGGSYVDNVFSPVVDDEGKPVEIYKRDSNNELVYSELVTGQYTIRADYFDYSAYKYGFEPYYFFGANAHGQDIFLRLAEGTRFSLILGICISAINLLIGVIWGAISGYYGGTVDLVMERITDIISNIPSLIILTICSIQFTNNISLKESLGTSGVMVLSFLVAFVYSGWVGVAGTTRMQFYRFKGQEYVLASRTLGAKDRRLIFRHILPNAIGTLVTSSVLMIPGVIFSESSLSFLGIINFTTSGLSSIGGLLSEGQAAGISTTPHIILFPCIVISLLMICFNLFGNGLRDAFNTSLKGAEE